MGDPRIEVKRHHVENCTKADPAYRAGPASAGACGTYEEPPMVVPMKERLGYRYRIYPDARQARLFRQTVG
ncbi:helix-turn-helix domain-containing protein, partial [Rhizobium sullae]